jgi:hypothetical protein|tara:strand:- start:7005 stop:7655 length:651 start_codon:yes stop_codon:yes gene_type:complete
MSFTYAELKSAIQDFTENTETTFVNTYVPIFIRTAEERILKSVQLDFFRKNATGNMTSGNKYVSQPTDFLAPFSLSFTENGKHNFLEFKDVSFVQTYSPYGSATGSPKYYSSYDNDNFIVGPTPNASSNVEIHYFYRPTSLTAGADSGTTWLSENAELSLLYGSLIEAYIYMKGEQDVMAMYDKRYQESLAGLKLLGEAKETTQDYRVGRVILPKQ